VLGPYGMDMERLLERVRAKCPRRDVGLDDVLDATVALVIAQAPESAVRRLSGSPSVDQLGLPIEMLYAVPYDR
jgi:predicted RNase H-like nuclease